MEKTNQSGRLTRETLPHQIDFDAFTLNADKMASFLNGRKSFISVWYTIGNFTPSGWVMVQDRFGNCFVGLGRKLVVGEAFELTKAHCKQHDDKQVLIIARVLRRVRMEDVQALTRERIQHRPFCYEVLVD